MSTRSPFSLLACALTAVLTVSSCSRSMTTVKAPDTKEPGTPATPTEEVYESKEWPLAVMDVAIGRQLRTVRFQLHPESAPNTVANFIKHANAGFYDGLVFHRTIRNFLVQTGDPLTRDDSQRDNWGTGGTKNALPPETKLSNVRGRVVMARLDDTVNPSKRSHATQFLFCLRDLPTLDGKYSAFGTVISGMDVLDLIGDSIVDTNDVPLERLEIRRLRVIMTKRKAEVVGRLGVSEQDIDNISVADPELALTAPAETGAQSTESGLRRFWRKIW